MTTQQQEQQPEFLQKHRSKRPLWRRWLIASFILLLMVVGIIIWILTSRNALTAILPIVIFTALGVLIALFQWLFPISSGVPEHLSTHHHAHEVPPIIVHIPATQPLHEPTPLSDKAPYRGIVGLPPPTDPRTIQQREHVVREVYTKLIQPNITAIALTGIGGVGKSTLAALLYRYVEEQRQNYSSPFQAETLWYTIDHAVTFADLAGNLFEALGKPFLDLTNLAPQHQAVALFNALNTTDKPRLVIVDQFENLLDWNTGHALTDRPGVGEWLDMLNSQQCNCRILLTSRPRPVGTREYPLTYLQEFPVRGLEPEEGIALLHNQGIRGTDEELQIAVSYCEGHAFSLTLLASLLRDHHLNLTILFKQASLWTGDIATNLLDQIYQERLDGVQRKLLLAFSVYRESVPFEAAHAVITNIPAGQLLSAFKVLVTQRLLEAVGGSRYQLHAIIAVYTRTHFADLNRWGGNAILQEIYELLLPLDKWQSKPFKEANIYNNLGEVYRVLGQLERALECLERASSIYNQIENRKEKGRALNNLGRVYYDLGDKRRAREYYEQALRSYREVEDYGGEGRVLNYLGRVFESLAQEEQAREYYEKALSLHREVGDRGEEGWTLYSLGRVYHVLGPREKALIYFENALDIHREVGDRGGEGWTLIALGRVYSGLRLFDLARKYHEEALCIHKEIGDRRGEGYSFNDLGKIDLKQGEPERAQEFFGKALIICREVGDRWAEAWTLNNLGSANISLGNLELAREYFEKALVLRNQIGDYRGSSRTLNNLGILFSKSGNIEQAIPLQVQALGISKQLGDREGEAEVLCNMSLFYLSKSQYKIALAFLLLARSILEDIQIAISLGDSSNDEFVNFIEIPYLVETQKLIDALQTKIGNEQFITLLATVGPQAHQIVDGALSETKQV